MPNYENSLIYKISCKDITITDCYVGSTTEHTKRKRAHENNCNNENSRDNHYYVYQFILSHGGWSNWTMIEIEKFPCKDNLELKHRERYWMSQLNATLNTTTPNKSNKECCKTWNENNPNYHKNWNQEHAIHIENQKKVKIKCECGVIMRKDGIHAHKKTKKHLKYLDTL